MIFQSHNFYENFSAAIQADDITLLFTIFSGELADILTQREDEVFDLFREAGIPFNRISVYSVYVDKILKGIKEDNEELIYGLSYLITDNNNEINDEWEEQLDVTSNGIRLITEYLNKNNENLLRTQILDAIQARRNANNTRKVDFNDTTIFTAVFAIAFIVLVFKVWKKKPAAPAKVEAPVLPENSPAMNVTPDVLVPEVKAPAPIQPIQQPPPPEVKPIEIVTPPPAPIEQVKPEV